MRHGGGQLTDSSAGPSVAAAHEDPPMLKDSDARKGAPVGKGPDAGSAAPHTAAEVNPP